MKFFECEGLSRKLISGIFLLKILFGATLWAVYTFYYSDRMTADIYKFFDASQVMYNAFWTNKEDFFRLLFGMQNDHEYFEQNYQTYMINWTQKYASDFNHETHTMIRFNTILRFFSLGGYYQVHSIFMCFISLTGLTAIYKTFSVHLKGKGKLLTAAVFLAPSVLFWGSGVLKEGLLIFALGMLIYSFYQLILKGFSIKGIIWICFSAFLLSITKLYILIAIVPCLIAMLLAAKSPLKHPLINYVITIGFFTLIGANLHHIFNTRDYLDFLAKKQWNFINTSKGGAYLERTIEEKTDTIYISSEHLNKIIKFKQEKFARFITYCKLKPGTPYYLTSIERPINSAITATDDTLIYQMYMDLGSPGSAISIPQLEASLWSYIKSVPNALVNTLLRPFLWEAKSPLLLISAIETFIIFLIGIACLTFMKSSFSLMEKNLLYFSITFVLIIFCLAGLTVPILGAIARYKVPAMPFLLIIFVLILDKEKLKRKLPFLKFM